MARYELWFKRSVTKDLRGLPQADVARILARIEDLRDQPRTAGAEKLAGSEAWRLRQGSWRVLCTIDDQRIVVEVVRIAHRREVYRR